MESPDPIVARMPADVREQYDALRAKGYQCLREAHALWMQQQGNPPSTDEE